MSAVMSLTSYLLAIAATFIFWTGVSQETLLLRFAGAATAATGIWLAESAERRARSGRATQAATLNALLLLVMGVISLYLHFTN